MAPAHVVTEMGYFLSLSKSATITGLNASEWGLLIAGLVLLAGIIGEYKLPSWHHLLKRFEALVLIGVLFELLFDGGIFFFTSHLQMILDAESAGLSHATASARQAAAEASRTANGFEAKIAASNKEAKQADALAKMYESQIADSNANAKEADAHAAEARSMAEAERTEQLRLRAIVAPRSLSIEQQRQIVDVCRKFKGHRASVVSYGMDAEAFELGDQIIRSLQTALGNDRVQDSRATLVVTGGFAVGLGVSGPNSERDLVLALGSEFRSFGLLGSNTPTRPFGSMFGGGGTGPTFPAGTTFVTIMIGVKPLPTLPLP